MERQQKGFTMNEFERDLVQVQEPEETKIALVSAIGGQDETGLIAQEAPLRIDWDKKAGIWRTDLGETEDLLAFSFVARRIYACWTDNIGQPICLGMGDKCPDHPDTSDKGYLVGMDTQQFGLVIGQFFGLAQRVMSASAKLYIRQGIVRYVGSREIVTRFGKFQLPVIDPLSEVTK
jgi:hypothetical protein